MKTLNKIIYWSAYVCVITALQLVALSALTISTEWLRFSVATLLAIFIGSGVIKALQENNPKNFK